MIDLAATERNIGRAADFYRHRPVKLRPHFKAHKISMLMEMQLAAGGTSGVTCATPYEALVLAEAGIDDILVANQVADLAGLAALARAAALKRVTATVDCAAQVEMLQATAEAFAVSFGVLIEIDVGMGRCGLNFGSPALIDLAAATRSAGRLEFLGLQGYEGHAVSREDRDIRRTMVWQSQQILRIEKERLVQAGFPCPVVSGGGTGTWDLAAEAGVLSEVQAGSYVLMDAKYGALDLPFENALFCCATLISWRSPGAGVLNAGWKSLSGEFGVPKSADGSFSVISLADEHARISPRADWPARVGDPVLLIPLHIDPTLNLHDSVAVYRQDGSGQSWPVDGRRRPDARTGYA
ncbi:alanine racemase [Chelativorans sp. AA-79]|uniref:alanine racemase n=1 Tax=Chelativorans sp. AA-79 TaxID=3028735 RepID=UPI0023F93CDF|nr:alanine racemase [Chelativorans sp. AA-79]WEX12427.1 alanine racemase [Chelativorans sp. AA-79]